jgi:hypothetical protein
MSSHIIAVFIYLFLTVTAVADTNTTDTNTTDFSWADYIDEKQKKFSKKVINVFDSVDESISGWFSSSDNNLTCDEKEQELVAAFFKEENPIDEFFKNDKYIEETAKSFLRVRFGSFIQSKDLTTFNYKLSAHIPLSKSKKNFNLFIYDIEKNYFDDTVPETSNTSGTPEVGVNYFAEEFHGIDSKYSIGVRGLSAFVRARYSKAFKAGEWTIQPTQQFKYSTKYDFEEETNLYFDKPLDWSSLFRTTLHRRTKVDQSGMDYRVSFSYALTPKNNIGLGLTQSFWGNTKYTCTLEPEEYSGISNYVTTFNWRKNIWREWIAYELQPGVSFHRQYDYEPNYMLRLNLDFYFGSI